MVERNRPAVDPKLSDSSSKEIDLASRLRKTPPSQQARLPRAPETTHHFFKITLSNSETWAIHPNRASPPSIWDDYLHSRSRPSPSPPRKGPGFPNVAPRVSLTTSLKKKALEHRTAAMVAARGGELGFFPERKAQSRPDLPK